ncbi:hypothetical protein ACKVMT_17225 [Halobacteriales archaeon Cl-PHB]
METVPSRRLSSLSQRFSTRVIALLTVAELLLLAIYFLATPASVSKLRYALYPFVWINVGLWAVLETDLPEAPPRRQVVAGAVALFYLATLLILAGLVGTHAPTLQSGTTGIFVGTGSPGHVGVTISTAYGYVALIPFRVVGYLALTYLVYTTLLDTVGGLLSGAIGLFSCISCTFPILASVATAIGGSAALTSAVFQLSLDLSTLIFVVAVGLLYWKPGLPRE